MTTRPGYVWDATTSEWVEIGQAAVLAPIKYQASQPSSPATGDIWIDSDDEVPSVDSTLYYRWTKTMSGGETSLSGTDNNSLALKYTPGYESVFINGVLQVRGSDYVASTGTTVTGLTALTASDVVMVESIIAYSVGDTYTQSQISSLLDAKSPVSTTGLVLLNTTDFSAVASASISSIFNSTYSTYRMVLNATHSASNNTVTMQFREASTNKATGYFQGYGQTSYLGTNTNAGVNSGTQFVIMTNTNSTQQSLTSLDIYRSATVGVISGTGYNPQSGNAMFLGGANGTMTAFDGLSISTVNGTMTGTIKVYGYK
jgi:hypothetical protein